MVITMKSPAKKPARAGKHVASRASAEEIRSAVGVTKKDSAVVRKVLADLGYLGKENKRTRSASKASSLAHAPSLKRS
jgi:hypothetical protein